MVRNWDPGDSLTSEHRLHHNELGAVTFTAPAPSGGDDTAVLQALIDEAIPGGSAATTTRSAIARIVLQDGLYNVSQLRVESVEGFELVGQGRNSIIKGTGSTNAILDLNGIAHCKFSDFCVRGPSSGTADAAILIRWNGVNRSTTMNTFSNIFLEGGRWVIGWQIADNNLQVDENSFYNCRTTGEGRADGTFWQHAWKCGAEVTANPLDAYMYHCNVSACRYGVSWAGSGGGWFGGAMQNNEIDFNEMVRCADPIIVKGSRNEGSNRLWSSTIGAGGYENQVSVEDVYYAATSINADGKFIRVLKGGFHRFKNIFVTEAGAVAPIIELDNANLGPGHVILENISTKAAGTAIIGTVSTTVTYDLHGYYQNDDAGTFTGSLYSATNGAAYAPVIATASLPVAAAAMNGRIIIEDAGAGDRNLIIYAGGQRFRIDGGANV